MSSQGLPRLPASAAIVLLAWEGMFVLFAFPLQDFAGNDESFFCICAWWLSHLPGFNGADAHGRFRGKCRLHHVQSVMQT